MTLGGGSVKPDCGLPILKTPEQPLLIEWSFLIINMIKQNINVLPGENEAKLNNFTHCLEVSTVTLHRILSGKS